MTTCPADDELVRMVEGALGAESLAALEAHVDGCAACAAVVGGLGAVAPVARVTFAGYELDRRIAAGGMGEVWAAWDATLQREVAIKRVRPEHAEDPRQRARLLREARALARLAHPNVLAVYDVGEEAGEVYLATELVAGDTLASRGGPGADWRAVVRLYVQAARGLAAAHALGLVHRDVKPANLLVGADGRVRVADFGLAVASAEARDAVATVTDGAPAAPLVTAAGHVAGTPAYMAPEQRAGGAIDARCDQYSLAVALGEGVTGRRPDGGATAAALGAWLGERRAREEGLDELAVVLARALALDPAVRHADMTTMADRLAAIADPVAPPGANADRGGVPFAGVTAAPLARGVGLRTWFGRGALAGAVVALAGGAVAIARHGAGGAPATLDDVAAAMRHRDPATCAAVLARLDPSAPAEQAELARAHCQMLAGGDACAAGAARLAAFYAAHGTPVVAAQSDADLYCPPDEPATREHRLSRQLVTLRPDADACAGYLVPARAVAATAADPQARTVAATILAEIAHCLGEGERCADARGVLHEAGALVPAIDNPSELPGACR